MAPKKKQAPKKTTKKAAPKKAATARTAAKKAAPKKAAAKKAAPVTAPAVRPGIPVARPSRGLTRGGGSVTPEEMVVVITVIFTGVAAGNSKITASFNGEESSRTDSGNITFSGVKKDDLIGIDGTSPGKTKVIINISATPKELKFEPGNFNDNFAIN